MKLLLLFSICLPATTILNAYTPTAQWTGKMEYITTVSGHQGVKCEYIYGSKTFWEVFADEYSCPSQVEVK